MRDITYCSHIDCYYRDCIRHQNHAPKDRDISIADLDDGYCFIPIADKRLNNMEKLLSAICHATQNTCHKCDNPTRSLCDVDGGCLYCATIADAIVEVFK